jgi:hypothetical protein
VTNDDLIKAAVALIQIEDAKAKGDSDLLQAIVDQAGVDLARAKDAVAKIQNADTQAAIDAIKGVGAEVAPISPAVEVQP